MITEKQILTILRPVKEPFLHKMLHELDAIKEIGISDEGDVKITLGLSKLDTPENDLLEQDLTTKLLRIGAKSVRFHFVRLPEEELLKHPIYKVAASPLLNGETKTHFIAIASGKGGVGKSTATVNLAVSLARLGKKVGIIDADIYGFSIPHMMGKTKKPTLSGNKIVPVEAHGVKIMSMEYFVEDNTPVVWRGPRLGKMLNSFFIEVEWGDLDYLLLDLPPGTGDMALNIHNTLPTSKEIIVTTPHATAAHVASRAGKMALDTNHEIIGVIENMSYFESKVTGEIAHIFGKGGGEKVAELLDTHLLAQIPIGQPEDGVNHSVHPADTKIGQIYKRIAEKIIETT